MDNILISSTEELSPEDRLLLSSSKRQEPQGEEHNSPLDCRGGSHSSSSEEEEEDEDDGLIYQNVGNSASASNSNSNTLSSCGSGGGRRTTGQRNNMSLDSNSHSSYNTLIIHNNNNSLLADTWIPASHEFTSLATGSARNSSATPRGLKSQSPSRENSNQSQSQNSHQNHPNQNPQYLLDYESLGLSELSDIPRDYLNQLTVLKHLAKEVQADPISEPPNSKLLRSASFSRSQPDLASNLNSNLAPVMSSSGGGSASYYYAQPPTAIYSSHLARKKSEFNESQAPQQNSITTSTSVQMLEILMRENSNLRAELANARMRIQTIHKLEAELTRLQKQHAALFESAERRESLERTARAKLSSEVKRLTVVNRELLSSSNSLQNLSSYSSLGSESDFRKELNKKDQIISQLISQNKELSGAKERQDIELGAQRATLEEQRTHIDILDSALTTAQGNVVRLEEENRRNQDYAEKVSQLQRALSSLQSYNEKREQSEKKLRASLESEITELKLALASKNAASNSNSVRTPTTNLNSQNSKAPPPPYPGSGASSASNSNSALNNLLTSSQQELNASTAQELNVLQEKLRQSEDKIQSLSSVVQRWENFFSVDGAAADKLPNTPNSWQSGGSSRGGTPAPAQFIFPANSNSELEWKVKELEARLVEKDNMLRALAANSNLVSNSNSKHVASASLSGGRLNYPMNLDPLLFYEKVGKCESEPPSYANLPPKLRLGGSGSSLAKNSNESLGSSGGGLKSSEGESVSSGEGKSIDEQLKELNTQLLSKGPPILKMAPGNSTANPNLCCIPGFSHPSAAAGKRKVPQPLLESLNLQNLNLKVLPPLPRPPAPNSNSTSNRTSSGPPFTPEASNPKTTPNVFTPVSGLPPKSPGSSGDQTLTSNSKCRSLERTEKGQKGQQPEYSCKSLDRREIKASSGQNSTGNTQTQKPKSSVGSKAAFFGSLLSRRSPSPSRKATTSENEKSKATSNPSPSKSRFTFGRRSQSPAPPQEKEKMTTTSTSSAHTQDEDTEFLANQGRCSQTQRSRFGKFSDGDKISSPSPWVQRRSGGEFIGGGASLSGVAMEPRARKSSLESGLDQHQNQQKWGKVQIKSPFGIRYTFGAQK